MYSIYTQKKWILRLLIEVFLIGILGALAYFLLRGYSNLGTLNDILQPKVRYLVVLSPVYAIYFITRTFFPALFSFALNIATQIIIILINNKKIAETQEPLSWGDLTSFENYGIAIRYLDMRIMAIFLTATLFLLFIFMFCKKKYNKNIRFQFVFIILSCVAIIFAAPQYIAKATPLLANPVIEFYNKNIPEYYFNYNWTNNQIQNGVYTHLIQTSVRPIPALATNVERVDYAALTQSHNQKSRPKHIVFILCESCWHDDDHFTELFQPLRDEGMIELRGISPVYGGGTPNAEFEMYTALSARTVLQGIIFQEYAKKFSPHSETIVSNLHKLGYSTLAFHNFERSFWQRDIVLEKLGFERYRGIEDMNYVRDNHMYFPADSILFDDAFKILSNNINQSFFASLLTVSTHGGYAREPNDEYGIKDYMERLQLSISEAANFINRMKTLDPDALLVLYGDHKPGLGNFFNNEGIFKDSLNIWDSIGDVPIYIGYSDYAAVDEVKAFANNLPFYCVSAAIDKFIIKSGSATAKFAFESACENYASYDANLSKFPSWLYRLSLFE